MKSLIASRRLRQIMVLGVATSFAISSCGGSGDSTTDSSSAVSIDQPLHVVISEINYHDVSDTDANDFIELHNNHDDDVALTGWCIKGVGYCFTQTTVIKPGAFLVVRGSDFDGRLGNKGERIRLVDAQDNVRDEVNYSDSTPWPESADGDGDSLHRVELLAIADSPNAWVAAPPTPGEPSPGKALAALAADSLTEFSEVTHTVSPSVNSPVRVTASLDAAQVDSAPIVQLHYRYNFNSETSTSMTRDADGRWSASIPGAAAGTLIRYRLETRVNDVSVAWPSVQQGATYDGTVVASPNPTALPRLQWFMDDTHFQDLRENRKLEGDTGFPAVFAYDGQIIDNALIRIKGQESRGRNKNKYKVSLPTGRDWDMKGLIREPVNEFGLHSMLTDKSFSRELLTYDLQLVAGGMNQQVFPVRLELNNEFYGLYLYHEQPDGRWRKSFGFNEDTVAIKGERISTLRLGHTYRSDEEMNIDYRRITQTEDFHHDELRWLIEQINQTDRQKVIDFAYRHIDIPQVVNALAVARVSQHVELEHKNWMMFYDPRDEKWRFQPIDHDLNFGKKWTAGCKSRCDDVFANSYINYMEANRFARIFIRIPQFREMLDRRTRTLSDLYLREGVIERKLGEVRELMAQDAEDDIDKWGQYGEPQTMKEAQDLIVDNYAAQKRGYYLRDDAKYLPTAQARKISYTISGTDKVRITNTDSVAIDISGENLPTLNTTVPPGTVLLPGKSAVFISERIQQPADMRREMLIHAAVLD
jgi:spore coat protein CotH